MRQLTLREIQLKELEMLRVYKALCEANHLYYTLSGGTMLGAVRHQGFIPWDDDIDVMMPRPDFDRLLNMDGLDLSMIPGWMEIVHWRNGGAVPFIKLVNKETVVDDRYSLADKHLWIDVLPVDGCPEDDERLAELFRRVLGERKKVLLKSAKLGEGKSLLKKMAKPIARLLMAPLSIDGLCEQYDALARTYDYNKCEQVACVTWGYGPQERIDKRGYETPMRFNFEGDTFVVPSNYHEYLTGLYGDYMTPPPEAERHTRHDIRVYEK